MINIKKATNYNSEEISLQFTRNIKQNLVEIVDTVTKLQNIVSQETLISLLPFVEDVSEELDKVNTEKENEFNNYELNTIE
jgi:SPP1 family phage portal protein